MKIYLIISLVFILALSASITIIPLVIKWVNKKGLLAQPNHRSSHIIPTPSLGGIGIFLGLLTVIPFLSFNSEVIVLLISVVVLFAAGWYDDINEMKSLVKLFIQLVCAVGLYFAGFKIDNLHGIFGITEIHESLSFIITVLFIAGVTNAFNLIDGINGLAGGITLINSIFFGFIFLSNHQYSYALIAFSVSGAIVGFLKYNYHPAKIFMGDTGSLFLGLLMSIFTIKTLQTNTNAELSISVSIVLIFLPIFDTLRLFAQRILKKKSPFSADKNHLHHLVLKIVPNHAYATNIICAFQSLLLIGIVVQNYLEGAFLLTVLLVVLTASISSFLIAIIFIQVKQRIQKIKESITSITNSNKLLENL
jgi:UDP-N-acetylmuramyl pentapeptide phosphotransferase/UDP-N-acetylglucosamine-1-phosphate transferase